MGSIVGFLDPLNWVNRLKATLLGLELRGRGALLQCNKVKRETQNVCCPRNGK